MANDPPFAWVNRIDDALRLLDKVPLFGNAPEFDIGRISEMIASRFAVPVQIKTAEASWRKAEAIKKGLGSNVVGLNIVLTPLAGDVVWLMGREDIARLSSWLMSGKAGGQEMGSEILQEGFYRYLAVSALDALSTAEPFQSFSMKLSEEGGSLEDSYCIDISFLFKNRSVSGCLVLSNRFLTSWRHHFSSLRDISFSKVAESIEVPVSISTGSVHLTAEEWKKIEKGDFVLLDRGGYDPRHREGAAALSLGGRPLFSINVKENKLKVLDYALVYEETMETNPIAPEEIKTEALPAAEEEKAVAIKKTPLMVTVELARLRMTVDHLMKLKPGNMLEVAIDPQQEVSLTVNGQKIGRGELVHLGEALGVRIIEIAG